MQTHLLCAQPEIGPLPLGEVFRAGRPVASTFSQSKKRGGSLPVTCQAAPALADLAVIRAGVSKPMEFLPRSIYQVLVGRYGA